MSDESEADASASGAATECTEIEFHVDDALAETLCNLRAIDTRATILIRVIDHACLSLHCISHRVVDMLRQADLKTSADLCDDQLFDVCGYIATDAVCRLRDAALAEANNWYHVQLPDYARPECISRGNTVLHKKGDNRILDADEVNRIVRLYSNLDQTHKSTE